MQVSHFYVTYRWVGLLIITALALFGLEACSGPPQVQPQCSINTDCEKGFYCHQATKTCRRMACQSNTDCPNGEICVDGSCKVSNTDGGLNDIDPADTPKDPCAGRVSCKDHPDCMLGEKCVSGCCMPGCSATTPCPQGLHCKTDTQECVACVSDEHCGTQSSACQVNCTNEKIQRCVNHVCAEANCECPLGTSCDQASGQCKTEQLCPGGEKPGPDGKCPTPCATANCPQDQTPDPENNCQCIALKVWCAPCTRDAECGLNGRCVEDSQKNKFCAEDCTTTRTCSASGYSCLTLGSYSVCMPISGSCPCLGVTCPGNQKCCMKSGSCHECCEHSDCQQPNVCRADGTCGAQDKCTNIQCQPGQQCDSNTGQCACQKPCPSGTCCDQGSQRCTANACGSTNQCTKQCPAGEQCCMVGGGMGMPAQEQCLPAGQPCPSGGMGQCQTDSDCQQGEMCCNLMGMGAMCMQDDGNILMKLICGGGGSGCQSDADCPAGEKCCDGLLPMLPKSCKASCSGLPFP